MSAYGITELLAIAIDHDDVRHAMYPTSGRTLCGRNDGTIAEVIAGDNGPPDCSVCKTTACAFDHVDRSAPTAWFRAEAAVAA